MIWRPEGGIRAATRWRVALSGGGGAAARATCSPSTRPIPSRSPTTSCGTRPTRPGGTGRCSWSTYDGRLTLAVPGTEFTADRVLETLARLAKAVGARPGSFAALLRLGE